MKRYTLFDLVFICSTTPVWGLYGFCLELVDESASLEKLRGYGGNGACFSHPNNKGYRLIDVRRSSGLTLARDRTRKIWQLMLSCLQPMDNAGIASPLASVMAETGSAVGLRVRVREYAWFHAACMRFMQMHELLLSTSQVRILNSMLL